MGIPTQLRNKGDPENDEDFKMTALCQVQRTPTRTGQEALKKLLKEDETDMKLCMSQLFDR